MCARIRLCLICQTEKIIDISGNVTLSHFVIGITDLCAFQIGGNVLLKQVVVFAQVTDTAVHKQSRLDNDFIFCEI